MQQLPYAIVTNPHINDVYNLYYSAFDTFRKFKDIKTLDDNDRLCEAISENLKKHLTVIPKLAMGIHQCEGLVDAKQMDKFMNIILKSVSLDVEALTGRLLTTNPSAYHDELSQSSTSPLLKHTILLTSLPAQNSPNATLLARCS